jgi:putative membrane protein
VGLLALLHGYIAWFEIFAWETRGPEIFSVLAPELFEPTKSMAANQGLYNAFLGAGLLWSLLIKDQHCKGMSQRVFCCSSSLQACLVPLP